jgi:3-oxoacyl-[acyl-carrier-protein] synthase-1
MTAYLNALGLNCALGMDIASVSRALSAADTCGLRAQPGWVPQRVLPVAAVPGELPQVPAALRAQGTRNNRLLLQAALQIDVQIHQAIARFGPSRIAVVLGTSTSGIDEASRGIAGYLQDREFPDDYDYRQQELGAPAAFLADLYHLAQRFVPELMIAPDHVVIAAVPVGGNI